MQKFTLKRKGNSWLHSCDRYFGGGGRGGRCLIVSIFWSKPLSQSDITMEGEETE